MTTTMDPIRVFTAFPWYTDQAMLNHRKAQCKEECQFKLLSPSRSLLPFHIKRDRIANEIATWIVMCPDGTNQVTLDPALIKIYAAADGDHIIYQGDDLGLDLTPGFMMSVITDGINTFYSEMFYVECQPDQTDDTCWLVTETQEAIVTETSENISVCN